MSVYCRLESAELLLRTLSCLFIHKDCWATMVFTDALVVLHVEGVDQSSTATAVLPAAVFSEYAVTEVSLCVHVGALLDALLMLGPSTLQSNRTRLVLAFPTSDAKLLVELADTAADRSEWGGGSFGGAGASRLGGGSAASGRVLQCKLVTRPAKDRLLDLGFQDTAVLAQATMRGDVLRALIQDLVQCSCAKVEVTLSADSGVRLRGVGSPFGQVDIWLKPHADALLAIEDTADDSAKGSPARTCVSMRHIATACGIRTGTSSGGSGGAAGRGGGDGWGDFTTSARTASASASAVAGSYGFERLTLQINGQGQLSVIHTQRNHDIKATVTIVVGAAVDYENL